MTSTTLSTHTADKVADANDHVADDYISVHTMRAKPAHYQYHCCCLIHGLTVIYVAVMLPLLVDTVAAVVAACVTIAAQHTVQLLSPVPRWSLRIIVGAVAASKVT